MRAKHAHVVWAGLMLTSGCIGAAGELGGGLLVGTGGGGGPVAIHQGGGAGSGSGGGHVSTGGGGGNVSTGGGNVSTGGGSTGGGNGSSGGGSGGGTPTTLDPFSFFVTSYRAIQALSGSAAGFGGDLRYGETGAGAGLRGADKICAAIAERSMPGSSVKGWHAFLSATADETGKQVNAIDRIGDGPWYDRLGRLVASDKTSLLNERPADADAAIIDDFPNEDGVPNHRPDLTQPEVDNHDMLTGSDDTGALYGKKATCLDWTSALGNTATEGVPRVGHSWPRGGFGPMANWMSALDEAGCKAGVNLIETGPPDPSNPTVGSGGGYGGFYCFAKTP